MSKRKYRFKVTDMEALKAEYPTAVESIHIPARTESKPVYTIIAKLLDCGIAVPGIEIIEDEPIALVKKHG